MTRFQPTRSQASSQLSNSSVDAHKSADVAAIDTAINNLNTVMQAASQQMYSQAGGQQAGPQPGADAGQQEQPKQDDTIQDARL